MSRAMVSMPASSETSTTSTPLSLKYTTRPFSTSDDSRSPRRPQIRLNLERMIVDALPDLVVRDRRAVGGDVDAVDDAADEHAIESDHERDFDAGSGRGARDTRRKRVS